MEYTDITIPCHITHDAQLTHLYLVLVHQSVTDFTDADRADWYALTTVHLPVWTPAPPAVTCRCCGHTMDSVWQRPIVTGRPGYFMVTCEQPGCPMEGYTFSDKRYQEVNLAEYTR